MRLKLDGIRLGIGRGIDEGMCQAERPVVRLSDLGDDEGLGASAESALANAN